DRVADLIMSGVRLPSIAARPGRIVNRQDGAAATWATTILVADAEVAPETGPLGWVVGLVAAFAALAVIGASTLLSENVADTGIMEEARALVAEGGASDICSALAILMARTSDNARDNARKQKIKRTQKAMGCRHSTFSK
ncbi:MAG: polymorphic toxin type 34 domain-containing protein, partial [Steroidobacteraceae bacterium]